MAKKLQRRDFLIKTSCACLGGCILLSGKMLPAIPLQDDEPIDPEKLCYCGYSCPANCDFLVATTKGDKELLRKVWEQWELKERYGLEFDEGKLFCYTCKPIAMPIGPVLTHCPVRACAIEKGYQACIQCGDLKECDKDLWDRYPQFYDAVLKMQEKYREQT
jgi:hypothetical protein